MSASAFVRGRFAAAGVAALAALGLAVTGGGSGLALPAVQPQLPAGAEFISAADAAPGPAYTAKSRRFTPTGIQGSYDLAPLYAGGHAGQGRTIAIVDSFGYDQAAADLETFSQAYGLPLMCGMPNAACQAGMPTFQTLSFGNRQVQAPPYNHSPGQEASNAWSIEVALDIEYAHTTAPMANILLVTTPTAETLGVQGFPAMMNAEQYVVDHHLADVVTQSFGAAEGSFGSTASLQNLRHAFESGTQAGITFLASSGDYGSTGSSKTPVGQGGTTLPTPEVGWPASDPLVTAVGGTNLCTDVFTGLTVDSTHPPVYCTGSNAGQRETAWNGSGGGYSKVFARPAWQAQLPAGSSAIPAGTRGVPDISMVASCNTYVIVLDTAPGYGGYYGVCGTSAASPMFAGLVAIADQIAGQGLGQINDDLYALADSGSYGSAMFDVTKGDNIQAGSGIDGFLAGSGWDAVTGLGTPDGAAFVPALAALGRQSAG